MSCRSKTGDGKAGPVRAQRGVGRDPHQGLDWAGTSGQRPIAVGPFKQLPGVQANGAKADGPGGGFRVLQPVAPQ